MENSTRTPIPTEILEGIRNEFTTKASDRQVVVESNFGLTSLFAQSLTNDAFTPAAANLGTAPTAIPMAFPSAGR